MPSLAELKRYCILPLGLPYTPEGPPFKFPKVASILLYGPPGVGKRLLVRSIATEIGAKIFNISPRNTAGQFVGKANVTKMIHMVWKVAKANGPAIIYLDGVEMIFAKKVPKDDTSDPKRIKKDLTKSMKLLRDFGSNVILIATSSKPWEGDAKTLLGLFDKTMYCPKPDYGSRYMLWNEFITRKSKDSARNINLSILTRMSDGFSAASIEMVCGRVLTKRRINLLSTKPLQTHEFFDQLAEIPAQNPDEIRMWKDFIEKTPIVKQRTAMMKEPEAEEDTKKDSKKKK